MGSNKKKVLRLPELREYQKPVLYSNAIDDITVSAPQLGKSMAGACWLLATAWKAGRRPEVHWWVSPTFQQCKDGYIGRVVHMARGAGILKANMYTTSAPLRMELINGAIIEGRSWERAEGLFGATVLSAVIDEFGQMNDEAYGALSSRRAETLSMGYGHYRYLGNVGDMDGPAEMLWRQAEKGLPGFAHRRWTWRDRAKSHQCCKAAANAPIELGNTRHHSKLCQRGYYMSFICRERERLSSPQFRQLYEAEWLDWNLVPAYQFDREVHIDASLTYNPSLPIDLCCDFNVSPQGWTVGQHKDNQLWTLDEISVSGGATTVQSCKEFIRLWPFHGTRLNIYGDATGRRRDTRSKKSDYDIIHEMLGSMYDIDIRVPTKNPAVSARLNAVNAKMQAADGEVRYRIHPKAEATILDWARVALKPGTREIDKTNKKLTHFSDAEGYRFARLFPTAPARVINIHQPEDRFYAQEDLTLSQEF